MKSRSHRLPTSDPPDDWGDGSWTVDCSCGVTFDDGEEMVSCDECGVWVHTRCSRFVRGDASFACHNCKNSSNPNPLSLVEETEVAQLLVELPTCPPPPPLPSLQAPAPPHRPPFRLWAEVPLEDRVHVQGLPGGDPALFQEIVPSVFTSELWKRTGYVPKKFNFQYREFSCWDEDGGENPASRGANVLFSLSKEILPERRHEERKFQHLQGWGKRERNKLRAIGSNSSKRKKEEFAGKKKVDRVTADLNSVGLGEAVAEVQNEEENSLVANVEEAECGGKPKHVVVVKSCKVGSTEEGQKQKASLEMLVKVEKDDENTGSNESTKDEDVNKAVHCLRQPKDESHYEGDLNGGSCHVVIDKEDPRAAIDCSAVPGKGDCPHADGAILPRFKLQEVKVKIDIGDSQYLENTKSLACPASDRNQHSGNQLPLCHRNSLGNSSDILVEHENVTGLSSNEHKSRNADKEVVFSDQIHDKTIKGKEAGVSEPKQHGQVVEESLSCATVQEISYDSGNVCRIVVGPMKDAESNLGEVTPSLHKSVIDVGKASSASHARVNSRPSVSSNYRSLASTASSTGGKAMHLSKQQVKVTSLTSGKKDSAGTVSSVEESTREVSRHVKGHSKDSDHLGSKSSQLSRIPQLSDSKHAAISDPKEPILGATCKSSTAMNITSVLVTGEAIGSSQTQNASSQLSSGPCQKEKSTQQVPHPPSRLLNNSSTTCPLPCATAATTLSDEELALQLHHELNSSPRVPRVPRMRQATGQLAPPTAPSMLSKRSSSYSGGKDQVFKRKNKEEAPKDISRTSHKVNETKRVGRAPSSPDRKYRESASAIDGSSKKDIRNKSPDSVASLRKNISGGACDGENKCQPSSEPTVENALSIRSSPRDVSDGDASVAHRTLPVLLDEIISKGKCSTYEELCDAVCPHWNNLRKPNGDRYAYSSHSHAVLDCLRNRTEWAHLIARGPKTNSTKRRRKLDSETQSTEDSEYEEGKKVASSKEVVDKNEELHREEFPKRKCNTRKRSRSELQGRDLGEPRKRRHSGRPSAPVVSDSDTNDDPAALSQSSNGAGDCDGLSSEEESGGGGELAGGAELSTSSSSGDTDDS